jgi:hypothetical protein
VQMLVNDSEEYPEPEANEASNQVLLHEPECLQSTSRHAPPTAP